MRQRDAVRAVVAVSDGELPSDRLDKWPFTEELTDRELAHRQDEVGLEQRELALQPARAIRDFIWRRHAIAAFRTFSRKAATHRRKINPGARFLFRPAERAFEPFEQC